MNVRKRIALATSVGLVAAAALAGCATAPSKDTAEDMAVDFVAWIIDDVIPADDREAEAYDNPFPHLCEGALDKSIQYFGWLSSAAKVGEAKLVKREEKGYWFVVSSTGKEGGPTGDMPVKIEEVDGKQCVAAAGEPAEVRD